MPASDFWLLTSGFLTLQTETDLLLLLRNTGLVSRIVLAILLVFSVWSWGIILSKALLMRKIMKESEAFWKIFRESQSLPVISTACRTLRFTPLVPVFNAGFELLHTSSTARGGGTKTLTSIATLQRSVQRAAAGQLTELEKRLTFLATTGSVTPFIGLFGTVWGVISAFSGLANASVATLRAVAPGIAEALIATAFGLFAAIPAVVAYNHFVYQIRNMGGQLDDLQVEFLALAERNDL